jgi:F-type H+-transporting ATPase subunit gamma
MPDQEQEEETAFVSVGKRGGQALWSAGKNIVASFHQLTNAPRFEDTIPIARLVRDEFLRETADRVLLAFTDYVSPLRQAPHVMTLLPLSPPLPVHPKPPTGCLFEPSPRAVLDRLLPRLIETMIWMSLLESSASEHSARMLAMRSAADAAEEMLEDLTFTFHQARQAGITREMAEISSGKMALE